MELEIYSPSDDGFVKSIEWNHEAIKKELAEKVKHYQTLVYTDAQIRDAKADRAKLNKFVQALETKRKEIKKQCLAPYEAFEKQLKEVIGIVNEPIQLIDKQIKGYEEQQRADKLDLIKNFWESCTKPFPIELGKIFNAKWLNVSVKMTEISSEIDARLAQIETDLHTLSELPDFAFESIEVYKDTLDINKAISEGRRLSEIAKRKAEYIKETKGVETVQPEKVSTPDAARQWIGFRAFLSYEEAKALKQFFDSNSIKFEAI